MRISPRYLLAIAPLLSGFAAEPMSAPSIATWTRYEAENAQFRAEQIGPSRHFPSLAAEASGRMSVKMTSPTDWIEFTVSEAANSLVIRYSIPDGPNGGGLNAALEWSINGAPQPALSITSRFAWVYGEYPWSNAPREGDARRFYDECSFKIPPLKAGDVLRFAISPTKPADYLALDFVELEQIAPPLQQPDGSLSISHFGAVPNDGLNDRAALLACIRATQESGSIVWIPKGAFELEGPRIVIGNAKIQGAGMWHSKLTGSAAKFEGNGETVHFADIAIFGDIDYRDNQSPDNAFNGNFGKGSIFERLWIEHVKCAFWTLNGTDGLVLRDSRIRNVMADGLNFCDGTSRSIVENCHIRNTGDDALATWSPTGDWSSKTACVGNKFISNLIEQPWHANGIGIYGGGDHHAIGNIIRETVTSGAGILVSSGFEAIPLTGQILIEQNHIESTGGDCYIGERVGGLWFHAKDSNVEAEIVARSNTIIDSADSGISIHGPKQFEDLQLTGNRVETTTGPGLNIWPSAGGKVVLTQNEWLKLGAEKIGNQAGEQMHLSGAR